MKILFLSHRVPYPPDRGDKIATWNLVDHIRREHEVRICAFSHGEADDRAARALEEMGLAIETFRPRSRWRSLTRLIGSTPLTLAVYGSRAMQACVDRHVKEVDLVYAYSSSMGAFLMKHELPRLMHFAELDSDKWRQYAGFTRFPGSWIYRREARTLLAFERRLAHSVDENIVCTPLEKEIFESSIPGTTAVVVANGVDTETFRPDPGKEEPDHLVFVGVMDYYPNVEGCLWFCDEILPRLRERRPDVRFSIVGSQPTARVRALAKRPGVEVTGRVDDPRDWLRRASVVVAPLRIARGIQNKVLEALSMGLAVVGTTSATQGVGGQTGRHYLVEDRVEGQVARILELLDSPERARELGREARLFIERNYPWKHTLRALDGLLEKHAPAPAGHPD